MDRKRIKKRICFQRETVKEAAQVTVLTEFNLISIAKVELVSLCVIRALNWGKEMNRYVQK